MNEVTLTGCLRTVSVYTDGEIVLKDKIEWGHETVGSEITFYTDDRHYEIVFDEQLCDYIFNANRTTKQLKIGGELKTKVSLGTGIATNYIKVTRVEVLQEEENE